MKQISRGKFGYLFDCATDGPERVIKIIRNGFNQTNCTQFFGKISLGVAILLG